MKKLTFLVAALCATMALNAAEVAVATCDFTAKTAGGTAYNDTEWEYGDYKLAYAANNNGGWEYMKFGAKSGTSGTDKATTGYIKSPQITKQIDKIVVNFNAGNLTNGSCDVWGVEVYSDNTFSTLIERVTGTAMTAKTAQSLELVPTAAGKWAANSYYKVFFECHNTTTKNGVVWVNSVEFKEIVAVAVEDPEFSVSEGAYLSSQSVQLSCVTDGASIYYTLDGSDPDDTKTLYESAISVSENTTIKAIAIKGAEKSNIVSAKYTIIHNDGTEAKPFTCADVLALQVSSESVWVEGYIIGAMKSDGSEIDNTMATNLAIAGTSTESDVANMVSVQLPSGSIRTALNVKDNASNIGKKVQVYGTIEAYLNHAGVKSVTDYKIEGSTTALETIEMSNIYANNGRIYGAEQGRIYTINGMDVTEQNGQLSNGIYIVKVGAKATKIAVK